MPPSKELVSEARFLSPLLSWDDVVEIAKREGFETDSRKPGEIARYLAWRLHQYRPRITVSSDISEARKASRKCK